MYDRNLGSYLWCGTGRQKRPNCQVCSEQMLPVLFGSKEQKDHIEGRVGGRGTAWIWGGHSPKVDSPYWCCPECGLSYTVTQRDSLKLPTIDELKEHIRVTKQLEL